jgi:hypothetical protein
VRLRGWELRRREGLSQGGWTLFLLGPTSTPAPPSGPVCTLPLPLGTLLRRGDVQEAWQEGAPLSPEGAFFPRTPVAESGPGYDRGSLEGPAAVHRPPGSRQPGVAVDPELLKGEDSAAFSAPSTRTRNPRLANLPATEGVFLRRLGQNFQRLDRIRL